MMKQGLPETSRTALQRLAHSAKPGLLLAGLVLISLSGSAGAQDSALVMVADTGGLAPEVARSAFAVLLAELRTRHPSADLRADAASGPAAAFMACEQPRCRASLMLRWHAFAVVVVTFAARDGEPRELARVVLRAYDASGERTRTVDVELASGAVDSNREGLRAMLESLTLPRPSFAPLLVTCDVPGARVFLNARALGVVPLGMLRVAPGRHRLHVSAPGYAPYDQTVVVPAAGARVDLRLLESAAP